MIVDGRMWKLPLTMLCLFAGGFGGGLPLLAAEGVTCSGAPVTLTPEHFQKPVCIFVRSRGCPQSPGPGMPVCNFDYQYFGPDGLFHPISGESIFQQLPAGVPVLMMIHGSFVDFEDEPLLLYNFEWIRSAAPHRPLLVLCYRWPSNVGCCGAWLGTFAVCAMAQRSEFHGFYLAQLINQIPPANPVRLMGHSHGCRMISSALHLLSGGEVNGRRLPAWSLSNRPFRVSFFSAAIDHDWFNPGQKYDQAIHRMCWLQNFKHTLDWALLTYPGRYPGSSRALGQTGLTRKDVRRLGAEACKVQDIKNGTGALLWGHGMKSHLADSIKPLVLSNIYGPEPQVP